MELKITFRMNRRNLSASVLYPDGRAHTITRESVKMGTESLETLYREKEEMLKELAVEIAKEI